MTELSTDQAVHLSIIAVASIGILLASFFEKERQLSLSGLLVVSGLLMSFCFFALSQIFGLDAQSVLFLESARSWGRFFRLGLAIAMGGVLVFLRWLVARCFCSVFARR